MKAKTHKTAIKRVRVTKNGKILKKHIRTGHLKVKQSSKTIRRKSGDEQLSAGMGKRVKMMLTGV